MIAMTDIYHDNGAALGNRTRFFKDGANGGVDWMYGVDYASGSDRWFAFGMQPGNSIAKLLASGMFLSRIDNGGA